jgi:hypothetical protein
VPADAFLSGPGAAGASALADKLSGMKPGAKRTLVSLELESIPAVGIAEVKYAVECKPDANGHRVFAVQTTQNGATGSFDLVLDNAGLVIADTLTSPFPVSYTRK